MKITIEFHNKNKISVKVEENGNSIYDNPTCYGHICLENEFSYNCETSYIEIENKIINYIDNIILETRHRELITAQLKKELTGRLLKKFPKKYHTIEIV